MQQAPNPFVTRILWIALMVSQVIYLGLPGIGSGGGAPQSMAAALAMVATSQAVGVIVYFRVAAVNRIQGGTLDPKAPAGASALFTVLILCWVLIESIAIYGLVLRFLGGAIWQTGLFSLAAFALMAATNPWQVGLEPPASSEGRGRDSTPIA